MQSINLSQPILDALSAYAQSDPLGFYFAFVAILAVASYHASRYI